MKFNSAHKIAIKVAALTTLLISILLISFLFSYPWNYGFLFIPGATFLITYFTAKLSFRSYLKKEVQSLLGSDIFNNEIEITDDLNDLDFEKIIRNIKQFVDKKMLEIEKLHSRDDFRKEFLGNVSHELKTPIFTAQGYILTLLGESMDDEELKQKYLDRANKSIERLSSIVKDLDMISKLEMGGTKLEESTFNIVGLVNDVFEILEIKAAKRKITLSFDKIYEYPLYAKGDFEKIQQVLINLITNSINYGKLGGTTIVSISSFDKQKYIVKVQDNGIGIHEKHIPRLFERFYRVDKSRSREHGGSGLGLAIVKHTIEAHDQELFVESELGHGSAFSFTLKKVV
ncbi:sensor histidine kinase [Namhaeicola litoreus]|uniref:histidine kinase n=1 Tax=Namhaeicola litoreus TaxID=1052145 RepID=A0ABW3XZC5_9FLAO